MQESPPRQHADENALTFLRIGRILSTPSGAVIAIDAMARQLLGLAPSDRLESIATAGTPDRSPLEVVLAEGALREHECWLATAATSSVPVVLSARLLSDTQPAEIEWFVRRFEPVPEDDRNPYRAIFEQVDDAVVIFDAAVGEIIDSNSAAREMFGYQRAHPPAPTAVSVSALPPDKARQIVAERLAGAERGERQLFEWEIREPDGRHAWLEVSLRKARVAGVDRVLGVMRNVTERKRSELAHRQTEERLRTILNTTHEIVWTLDLEGRFTFVNARGEEATGHRVDEWLGVPFDPIIAPEDREMVWDCFRKTMAGGRTRFNTRVVDATRQFRSLLVNTAPLVENGTITGMVGLGTDVTDQVRLEEELHKAQKIESLGLLAGGIAHDFNNILTAILGGVTLARRQASKDASLVELLTLSEKACMRARDLTQQLLTFSRGGAPICRPASMADLVRETARFVSRGSPVRCALDIEESLWLVDMDESQMSQVLGNLILNAIQAMPAGGTVTICARNQDDDSELPRGSGLRPGPYVSVAISDSGVGIAPEHASKIFDPYFTTKVRGTGLGLATSYSIVRRHRGHIDFASTPGEGTTFRILVPATLQTAGPPSSSPHPRAPLRARILVVDDEPAVRQVAVLILEGLGYEALSVGSGDEAITLFRGALAAGAGFQLVVMDLTMPGGMSGWDTGRELRRIDPDVLLIASSGYSTDPIMADHAAYGFDSAVPKPYVPGDLDSAIREALKRRVA